MSTIFFLVFSNLNKKLLSLYIEIIVDAVWVCRKSVYGELFVAILRGYVKETQVALGRGHTNLIRLGHNGVLNPERSFVRIIVSLDYLSMPCAL